MRQKLIAQAFPFGRAGDQSRNIDKLDRGWQNTLRFDDGGQRLQTRIGYFNDADVRFDGAERVVFSGDARFGQGVEEGRFSDIRESDDAAFEAHGAIFRNQNRDCINSPFDTLLLRTKRK
jgi:hypothetical protein